MTAGEPFLTQDLKTSDFEAPGTAAKNLLDLNNRHALEMSELTLPQFHALVEGSYAARRAGNDDGFVLVFDQDARRWP